MSIFILTAFNILLKITHYNCEQNYLHCLFLFFEYSKSKYSKYILLKSEHFLLKYIH